MAARQLPRRILSLLLPSQPSASPRILSRRAAAEPISQTVPFSNSIFQKHGCCKRGLQTIAEAGNQSVEDSSSNKLNSDSSSCTSAAVSNAVAGDATTGHKVTSKLKQSSTHDLAMIFTCNVCETRSVKTLSKVSYEKGVVLARCSGCDNVHLIADRLGWFGEPGSVEEFLAERGEEVKKGSADTLSLTFDDLAGKNKLDV